MKKIISLFLFLLFMTGMANSQTCTFMGIDIEQSYISFNNSISSKLRKTNETDKSTWYKGSFAGISDCSVFVEKSPQNTVKDIVAMKNKYMSEEEVIRIVSLYTKKYGQPYQIRPKDGGNEYQYKVGNHRIQLYAGSMLHVVYYPRWFVLNTDDI